MVDESRDISTKGQMAVILRYVDNKGQVIEGFVGVQHVTETTSSKLKESIDEFLKLHDLSYSNLRGQGYDEASNMRDDSCCRSKENSDVGAFFTLTNSLVNVVGCSCKRQTSLKRDGDTWWNSHYGALISLITMFSSVVDVFDMIVEDCYNDSVVSSFCVEHEIEVPNMDDLYVIQGKSLRKAPRKTNCHHYKVELFFEVIDFQLTELDDRFTEGNIELLICLASLSQNDLFVAFDKEKLVRLAQMYPKDFMDQDRLALQDQLDLYIHFVRSDNDFSQLRGINELAKKMVEKGLHRTFAYVYLLVQPPEFKILNPPLLVRAID
ncbi:unnamed protein product [Malus baccata var. baccata]